MGDIIIGCGGWAYFKAEGDPLINYSKIFDFVELNTTFYKIPDEKICRIWKNKVQHNKNFFFTIKVHKDITHKNRLKPILENFKIFDKIKEICRILNVNILIFQTPYDLQLDHESIKEIDEFFSSIYDKNLHFVWEFRGYNNLNLVYQQKFKDLLFNYKIIHCTDIFQVNPVYINKSLAYTRIFGPRYNNKYQFDDQEIKSLNTKFIEISKQTEKIIVSFHTQRMIYDAARAQEYNRSGNFLSVTGKFGIQSILDAIKEHEYYPITKKDLLENHGWKIYDKSPDEHERISKVLIKIPNKTYKNRFELFSAIESVLK